MIDLHLHTTASDGRSTPADLVREAAAAGIDVMAVTDHDTVAAIPAVMAAAASAGITCVPGIEITAIWRGRDIHVLGYFIEWGDAGLQRFLERQREERRRRIFEIGRRLAELGVPVDVEALVARAERNTGKALGRPLLAAALVETGHCRDLADAFDRYLAEGQPAYVTRSGPSPAEVVERIVDAGGLASIAHPGKYRQDELIDEMAAAGLAAVEVFHPDHDADAVIRYQQIAQRLGLVVTGGSDYHGTGDGRTSGLGRFGLSQPDFDRLVARHERTASR